MSEKVRGEGGSEAAEPSAPAPNVRVATATITDTANPPNPAEGGTMTADMPGLANPFSAGPPKDTKPLVEVPIDHYEFLGEQGRGGIGVVRRARDRRLDREVAIKELQRDSHAARARFEREMRITAKLQHPGIVPVHECGKWPDGSPFHSMKLVEGRSLKDLIAEGKSLDQRLALLPHVLAVAETIAYAHSQQIIHRDLKPSNIVVGAFGETVVIDWGLAKDLANPAETPDIEGAPYRVSPEDGLTLTGQVMGTPAYMAPEQARGEAVGPASDVYSLGAILYHLLQGTPPHSGSTVRETLERASTRRPAPLSSAVAHDLAAITARSLHPDPRQRYESGAQFAAELLRFQAGQLVDARRYSRMELLGRWLRRHAAIVTTSALALLVLLAVVVVAFVRVIEERHSARIAAAEAQAQRLKADARADELEVSTIAALGKRNPAEALARARQLKHLWSQGRRGAIAEQSLITGISAAGLPAFTYALRGLGGAAFTKNGDRLALVDSHGITIVRTSDWRVIDLLSTGSTGPDGVTGIYWTPTGGVVFSRPDESVWLFQDSTLTEIFSGHGLIWDIDVDAVHGVAIACDDGTVWLLPFGARAAQARLVATHSRAATSVLFGPGTLVSAGLDGKLSRHDVGGGVNANYEIGGSLGITDTAWLDSNHLIAGDQSGAIHVIDTRPGHFGDLQPSPHKLAAPVVRILVSSNSRVTVQGADLTSLTWNPGSLTALQRDNVASIALAGPTRDWFAFGTTDGSLVLHHAESGLEVRIPLFNEQAGFVEGSPDGAVVALGYAGGARAFSAASFDAVTPTSASISMVFADSRTRRVVSMHTDGRLSSFDLAGKKGRTFAASEIATARRAGEGRIFHATADELVLLDATLQPHGRVSHDLGLISEIRRMGRTVAARSSAPHGRILLFELDDDGTLVRPRLLTARPGATMRIRWMSDVFLAASYEDGELWVINTATGHGRPLLEAGPQIIGLGFFGTTLLALRVDGTLLSVKHADTSSPETSIIFQDRSCSGSSLRLVESRDNGLFLCSCNNVLQAIDVAAGTVSSLHLPGIVTSLDAQRADDIVAIGTTDAVFAWRPGASLVAAWPVSRAPSDLEILEGMDSIVAAQDSALIRLSFKHAQFSGIPRITSSISSSQSPTKEVNP